MSTIVERHRPQLARDAFSRLQASRYVGEYFEQHAARSAESAWQHIYHLLLWIDPNTGYAHCGSHQVGSESRALGSSFHAWLAEAMGISAVALAQILDQLFRYSLAESALINSSIRNWRGNRLRVVTEQVGEAPPAFYEQILRALRPYLLVDPPETALAGLNAGIRDYWAQERCRKEIRDSVFPFTLGSLVSSVLPTGQWVQTDVQASQIEWWEGSIRSEDDSNVDMFIESFDHRRAAVVQCSWSLDSEAEAVCWQNFDRYVRFDSKHRGFDHYLITNEFDPARLNAVCDRREANSYVFKEVVHINTTGVLAAYGAASATQSAARREKPTADSSASRVRQQVQTGRLISLSKWLTTLRPPGRA